MFCIFLVCGSKTGRSSIISSNKHKRMKLPPKFLLHTFSWEKWTYLAKTSCIPFANWKGNSVQVQEQHFTVVCRGRSLKSRASGCKREQSTTDAGTNVQVLFQFYQFERLSTRDSTRPLGSLRSGSHLYPHTPCPHKPPSPFHTNRLDTALGSISDCWSRVCHPLYRNLYDKEQQLTSVSFSVSAVYNIVGIRSLKHHCGLVVYGFALLLCQFYWRKQYDLPLLVKQLLPVCPFQFLERQSMKCTQWTGVSILPCYWVATQMEPWGNLKCHYRGPVKLIPSFLLSLCDTVRVTFCVAVHK